MRLLKYFEATGFPAGKAEFELRRFAYQLQFDYLRQIAMLAIAAIGGIITLAGSVFAAAGDKTLMWYAVAGFVLSAYIAAIAQDELIKMILKQRDRMGWIRFLLTLSLSLFGLSLALFILFGVEELGINSAS